MDRSANPISAFAFVDQDVVRVRPRFIGLASILLGISPFLDQDRAASHEQLKALLLALLIGASSGFVPAFTHHSTAALGTNST
ncbi:MAG: hypothetical protein ACKOQM_09755 [Novosphingobium sp.]